MDALFWEPSWTEAPIDVFRERVAGALSGEAWVADGNLFRLGHLQLRRADTAIWLDMPLALILWRLVWRTLRRVVAREELWSGNRPDYDHLTVVRLRSSQAVRAWLSTA